MRVAKFEMVAERLKGYDSDFIDKQMNNADNVAQFIINTLQSDRFPTERFMVFLLDTKLKVIGYNEVSRGGVDSAPVPIKEVFAPAVSMPKCAAVIVAHNHPSGDPTPSAEDITVTERLTQAGDILGIKLIDHVIVGYGCWTSLRELGYIS